MQSVHYMLNSVESSMLCDSFYWSLEEKNEAAGSDYGLSHSKQREPKQRMLKWVAPANTPSQA